MSSGKINMRREIYYDVHEKVWRSTTPFAIKDDGTYVDFKFHRLKIIRPNDYKECEFDLINYCRDFISYFKVAPNFIKGNKNAIQSVSNNNYNEINQTFEIAEFKMKVDIAPDDYRDDLLEIAYRE